MDFDGDTIDSESISTPFGGNMRTSTSIIDLGKNLLRYAKENDFAGIQQMINKGAPFASDLLGMTAIHFSALLNNYEACELLLRAGINKDAKTKVDRSPLHYAAYYGNEKITQLLLSNNCAVNSRDLLRMTPLHWAVERGHKEIVTLLLEHNADVTAISKFGKTPIAIAVQTEQADLLEQLQHAKKQQEFKKFNEQQQKEMDEAINSITGLTEDIVPSTTTPIVPNDVSIDYDSNLYVKDPIEQLNNINTKTNNLSTTAIDLLKSHGISMMQDDDPSNNLLTTALKNGRQLVVSEGGKMLLNDVGKNDEYPHKPLKSSIPYTAVITDKISKTQTIVENETKTDSNLDKLKTLTKPKLPAKKVLKLISLQELRKMCGSDQINALKTMQSSNLIVKNKQTEGLPLPGKKVLVNLKSNNTRPNILYSNLSQRMNQNDDIIEESVSSESLICEDDYECDQTSESNDAINTSSMITMKRQIEDLQRKYKLLQEENMSFRARISHLESIMIDDYDSSNLINTSE